MTHEFRRKHTIRASEPSFQCTYKAINEKADLEIGDIRGLKDLLHSLHENRIGTTNLDFRSLYLHFECGAWMYDSEAVMEVKEDFMKTLEICQPITAEDCKGNIFKRTVQDFLRIFAPFM